ncbi:facilitated trehalose transporter Tret1-like [Pectinophora gossypiella]|uniref:facilitated trehalose transporter Tret1-like n=1 Tax=Pectinophora gossypiella TaxID=13191 RepID=UPI00214F3EE7|nr:facilitated trehalose transporter Tret1-like [Pectinophora gossypiella]XP_049881508.1 facilitated trehalose transporter Tret1-like [Pectinophora gossypiella]XP_049881509.1 facilitated trehalose transporter Tret1-like [Pectinophora gossypiella]
MGPFIKQSWVVLGAALNIAGHGCAHGYPAVLFAQLKHGPILLTDHHTSWIASAVGAMGIVGNFISPILMTRFGRQKAHLLSTVPALLGWVVFVLGNSVPAFLFARLLHGLALGLRTPLAAILVAEYTDPKYRGAFLGTFAISLGLGIFLSHIWGAYLTWKMTSVVCAMFPLAAMAIISLSPESPSWLVSKGKFEEAKKAFRWVRGDGQEQREELQAMIEAQKEEMKSSEQKRLEETKTITCKGVVKTVLDSIKEVLRIFKKKEFYKPAIIAITMLVIFEFGGAHMVPAYGNLILQSVLDKDSIEDVNWQFTVIDLLRTVCAFLAIFLLKYFKRRTILFSSGIMTVLSLTSVSAFVYMRRAEWFPNTWFIDAIPMSLMVLYTLSFCLGLVPLNWVICGEIFPLAYRSLGSTLSTSFLTPSFVVSMKTAPHMYRSIGVEGAFLVYSALLALGLVIMYVLLPETKDRTLQDIEDSFKGKVRVDSEVQARLIEHKDIVIVK